MLIVVRIFYLFFFIFIFVLYILSECVFVLRNAYSLFLNVHEILSIHAHRQSCLHSPMQRFFSSTFHCTFLLAIPCYAKPTQSAFPLLQCTADSIEMHSRIFAEVAFLIIYCFTILFYNYPPTTRHSMPSISKTKNRQDEWRMDIHDRNIFATENKNRRVYLKWVIICAYAYSLKWFYRLLKNNFCR